MMQSTCVLFLTALVSQSGALTLRLVDGQMDRFGSLHTDEPVNNEELHQVSDAKEAEVERYDMKKSRARITLEPFNETNQKVLVFHDMSVSCKGQLYFNNGTKMMQKQSKPYGPNDLQTRGCSFVNNDCHAPTATDLENFRANFKRSNDDKEFRDFQPGGPLETIVVLTQPMWGHYYHFLIDGLSRYVWVQEEYPELVKKPTTFFHTGMVTQVGQDWANLVGITTTRGPVGQGNRLLEGWWSAKTMIWPPSNQCAMKATGPEPHAMVGMRALIEKFAVWEPPSLSGQVTKNKRTALIIERGKGAARSITNQDDVTDRIKKELQGWDFLMFPVGMDIPTTCAMFHRADMVIGAHGAGLANLICTRKGVPVVELQQELHAHDFELLTAKLGLPYIGVPTGLTHSGKHLFNDTDTENTALGVQAARQSKIPNLKVQTESGVARVAFDSDGDNIEDGEGVVQLAHVRDALQTARSYVTWGYSSSDGEVQERV